jgi:hypothetical protein
MQTKLTLSIESDVIEQAKVIADAWAQIDPELTFGELNQARLKEQLDSVIPIEHEIMSLETRLTNLRNERDSAYEVIWDQAKRVRMGVKVIYGDDSSQYEMVGGTRLSDRKPVSRKPAPAA